MGEKGFLVLFIYGFKIFFWCPANRANPVFRQIFEGGSRGDSTVRVRWVVDVAAY